MPGARPDASGGTPAARRGRCPMRSLPVLKRLFRPTALAAALLLGAPSVRPAGPAIASADITAASRATPDEVYGELFRAVQRGHVFPDQKTFVDCVPREAPERILAAYTREKSAPDFDLRKFVTAKFLVPETPAASPSGPLASTGTTPASATAPAPAAREDLRTHLTGLWSQLRRPADQAVPAGSSLLPLPNPYVVPGGRFREVYYWDSYFTMLGLHASDRDDLIESMLRNFAFLVQTCGLIPNGNRTYYLSRSQPPFFALMVELLAAQKGPAIYREYLPALEKEYAYWMDETFPTRHVVHLPGGRLLNRYYDRRDTPRPEAFAAEEAVAARSTEPKPLLFRNLRSAAESGWDFSSRWCADGHTLATIITTDLAPIDLNCLLWQLEHTLATAYRETGQPDRARTLDDAADRRQRAIQDLCWSPADGLFVDYDTFHHRRSPALTLAGAVPLFFRLATPEQAAAVARTLRERFLRPGGVVTTLVKTGEQWDAPNGWAPLEWMTISGLRNYHHDDLARDIALRWMNLNHTVYARTGKMMEKYNVEDLSLTAGGGEYPSQDGFGWTNGVLLALLQLYPDPPNNGAPK